MFKFKAPTDRRGAFGYAEGGIDVGDPKICKGPGVPKSVSVGTATTESASEDGYTEDEQHPTLTINACLVLCCRGVGGDKHQRKQSVQCRTMTQPSKTINTHNEFAFQV